MWNKTGERGCRPRLDRALAARPTPRYLLLAIATATKSIAQRVNGIPRCEWIVTRAVPFFTSTLEISTRKTQICPKYELNLKVSRNSLRQLCARNPWFEQIAIAFDGLTVRCWRHCQQVFFLFLSWTNQLVDAIALCRRVELKVFFSFILKYLIIYIIII